MLELFDMGKYNFFVWSSMAVFIVALLLDFITASSQKKKIKKQIRSQLKRKENQRQQLRRNQT